MAGHYSSPRKIPRKEENEWNIVNGSKVYLVFWDCGVYYVQDLHTSHYWEFHGDINLSGKKILKNLTEGNKVKD